MLHNLATITGCAHSMSIGAQHTQPLMLCTKTFHMFQVLAMYHYPEQRYLHPMATRFQQDWSKDCTPQPILTAHQTLQIPLMVPITPTVPITATMGTGDCTPQPILTAHQTLRIPPIAPITPTVPITATMGTGASK